MASLVSTWSSNLKSLPDNYVLPEEKRPRMPVPISNDLPVIDLGDCNRDAQVKKIIKAGQEFGLFQVINHGVPKELMNDAMNVNKEFFDMSVDEKSKYYVDSVKLEAKHGCRLHTGAGYFENQAYNLWKDALELPCHPLENHIHSWPDKPMNYREIMGPYATEVRKLGLRIMGMIYEGLGVELGDIGKEFNSYDSSLSINHYPACPEPELALGAGRHFDPTLLALLQQEAVYGLQLEKDGQWIGVAPLPDAFVINAGLFLEVISNGKFKAVMHRAVTNSASSRNSLVTFLTCPHDATIKPAKEVISPTNPPLYRDFRAMDLLGFLFTTDFDAAVAYTKLKT